MASETDLVVIGIDPGINVTAVSAVAFSADGDPRLVSSIRIFASIVQGGEAVFKSWGVERQRAYKIWSMRSQFGKWLDGLEVCVDAIGYEVPGNRGRVGNAVQQCIGGIISQSLVWGLGTDIIAIQNQVAGQCYGSKVGAVRGDKKAAAIVWANETFGLSLESPEGEDIADACAVAVATRNLYLNPKARKPRKRKPDAK